MQTLHAADTACCKMHRHLACECVKMVSTDNGASSFVSAPSCPCVGIGSVTEVLHPNTCVHADRHTLMSAVDQAVLVRKQRCCAVEGGDFGPPFQFPSLPSFPVTVRAHTCTQQQKDMPHMLLAASVGEVCRQKEELSQPKGPLKAISPLHCA